jgi:acyl carrier protein
MNKTIQQIMAEIFEIPADAITTNSSQDNIENWDSLHHIKMIVAIERKFDITIPDEEVANMISYKFIEQVIVKLI